MRIIPTTRIAVLALATGLSAIIGAPMARAEVPIVPLPPPGATWDATSGYATVEAGRAALANPPASSIAADLVSGKRIESAHLATIPLPVP